MIATITSSSFHDLLTGPMRRRRRTADRARSAVLRGLGTDRLAMFLPNLTTIGHGHE